MLIRDIHFYIDTAKEKQGYGSDRQLGQALGYGGSNSIFYLRKGQTHPSDEKMVAIAELAGVNPEIALLDLAMWRTRGIAQNTYANILQKITHATLLVLAVIGGSITSTPAYASQSFDNSVKSVECLCMLWELMG